MLGNIRKDEVGGDWRYLVEPRLAELALDVIFAGKTEAAMELDAGICRFPACLCGQVFGHVCLRAAGSAGIEQATGLVAHQVGGLDLDIASAIGNWTPWFWPMGRPKTSRSRT